LFRPLDEAALQRLDDDALIEYMRAAREAGHASAAFALAVLVYGQWSNVARRVRLKIPPAHVEDVTAGVIEDAVFSAFEGRSLGQFRSWLNTITGRKIADFYRRGHGRMETSCELEEPAAPPETGEVELRDAIERVMARMRPDHRRVVDIVIFEDRPAADAAREIEGMTEANVHQIVFRFREALRGELEAGGDTP
jgi:DNA-directed RNA polymerase specialized sigma24 family protein